MHSEIDWLIDMIMKFKCDFYRLVASSMGREGVFHIHNEGAFDIGVCGLRDSQTPEIHGAKLVALTYQ